MATIASFDGTPSNDNIIQKNGSTIFSRAEIFTITESYVLSSASVYLLRIGSPTGTVDLVIRSISGTPGSTAIPVTTLATSSNKDVSTVATSYTLYNFTFTGGNAITLTPGSYALVVRGDNCTGLGGNLLETPSVGEGGLYAGNKADRASSSDTWSADEFDDMFFYVFGDSATTTSTSSSTSTSTTTSFSTSTSTSTSSTSTSHSTSTSSTSQSTSTSFSTSTSTSTSSTSSSTSTSSTSSSTSTTSVSTSTSSTSTSFSTSTSTTIMDFGLKPIALIRKFR